MKKSMIVITSLLAVALMATSAFSWGHGNKGYGKGCGGSGQGYDANAWNDLSPEQRDELTALKQKFVDDTYETRSAMLVKHQEMRMLMETSDPDRAKVDDLAEAVTELRTQMQTKRIDFQLAAKKIAPELNGMGMGPRGYGKAGGKGNNGDCPRQTRRCSQ